jgi:hypothetical protein
MNLKINSNDLQRFVQENNPYYIFLLINANDIFYYFLQYDNYINTENLRFDINKETVYD